MIISIDTEKPFDKNSTSIQDLNSQQTRNRRELPQSDKEHLNKTLTTLQFMTKHFLLPPPRRRFGAKHVMSPPLLLHTKPYVSWLCPGKQQERNMKAFHLEWHRDKMRVKITGQLEEMVQNGKKNNEGI